MSQQSPFGPPGSPGGFGPPPGGQPGGFGPPAGGAPGFGAPPGGPAGGAGGFGAPPGGFGPPAGGYGPPGGGFGGPPPNYGAPVPGTSLGGPKTEPMAIGSLVVGLLSLPTSCCCTFFGTPLSIIAVVLGILAMTKINKEPHLYAGKPLAIAGIVLGALGLAVMILSIIFGMGSAILGQLH